MNSKPLSIVVVGHTNAGKTSLLRALIRDKHFGEVSPRNATTRHVEKTSVTIAGEKVLTLYDTPGFEDSIAFHTYLHQFAHMPVRKKILETFLESPEAHGLFEQQAKVIKLLLKEIDAILYIIDSTESPFHKYECELDVLSMCSIPVLPVLNFVGAKGSHDKQWEAVLKDKHFHVKTSFDAVAPALGSERLLYAKLGTLLEEHSAGLKQLAEALEKESVRRRSNALKVVADLLIDVAALRTSVEGDAPDKIERAIGEMQARVRAVESTSSDALLAIYGFERRDVLGFDIPVISTSKNDDLFNAEAIMEAKSRLGIAALIGSAIGLGVDIVFVGTTLGAGTLLGGAIGGALGGVLVDSAKDLLTWTKAKYHGLIDLAIDDATLSVLLNRQLQLLDVLSSRSHAAINPSATPNKESQAHDLWVMVADQIRSARVHPEWSRLEKHFVEKSGRIKLASKLYAALQEHFENSPNKAELQNP